MSSKTEVIGNGQDDKIEAQPYTATDSGHSSDLDDTYAIYHQNADNEIDPAEAKRVLRKVDLRLVPLLIVIYFLQYIDKNGINYASAYGLQEGTNLHGQDYSWLGR
jgi:hypothetical protein